MALIDWGLAVRLVSYGVMVPGLMMLSMFFANQGYWRRSALMGLYSLAHLVALAVVVMRLMGADTYVPAVLFSLTPIVTAQSVLVAVLALAILRGTLR